MRKYLFAFLLFSIPIGVGIGLNIVLDSVISKDDLKLIHRALMSLLFLILILKFIKYNVFKIRMNLELNRGIALALGVLTLFAVNNYLLAKYATQVAFMYTDSLKLVMVGFVFNSFYEELAYRGFLQGYINQNVDKVYSPISQGNLFSSLIMLATHFGFFIIMDTVFAITGLILVLIYAFTAGYLRDKGFSIWFLILFHTLVNFIHVFMNLEHYLHG